MDSVKARHIGFRIGYALFAALLLGLGLQLFVGPFGLLPDGFPSSATDRVGDNVDFLHAIHEAGALLVALGLASVWSIFNVRESRPIHALLAVAFTCIAIVHWFDVRSVAISLAGYVGWGAPAGVLILSYFVHPSYDAAQHVAADRPTREAA